MQEIIAKIEKFIFDFKKQNENKLELHHVDVLNSFSEKERAKIKEFSSTLKPICNELTTFTRIFDNDIKSICIRFSDDVEKIILEWSYPREPIPGLVLTDTCWNYVDLNEVLKLIKAYK